MLRRNRGRAAPLTVGEQRELAPLTVGAQRELTGGDDIWQASKRADGRSVAARDSASACDASAPRSQQVLRGSLPQSQRPALKASGSI